MAHKLRQVLTYSTNREKNGVSVMILTVFYVRRKINIKFTKCDTDSLDCPDVLIYNFVPLKSEFKEPNLFFLQDSISLQKQGFVKKEILVLQ